MSSPSVGSYTCELCGREFTPRRVQNDRPHRYCSQYCNRKARGQSKWGNPWPRMMADDLKVRKAVE